MLNVADLNCFHCNFLLKDKIISVFPILCMKFNMKRFKQKKPCFTMIFLFVFTLSLNFILGEITQLKTNKIKFIDKNVPKSSLMLTKEFQSPSFSRLTCAASTEVMGKQAFHFDQKEQSCKIYEVKDKLHLQENEIKPNEHLAVKIDGL